MRFCGLDTEGVEGWQSTEDLKIQAEIFRACCCCFGKIQRERFSLSRWEGVHAEQHHILWKDGNCIGLSLRYASSSSISLFFQLWCDLAETQEPWHRWVSDPAAPSIFYFQAFVGVCGGQQWLQGGPSQCDGMSPDSSLQPWHPSCGASRQLGSQFGKGQKEAQIVSWPLHRAFVLGLQLFWRSL